MMLESTEQRLHGLRVLLRFANCSLQLRVWKWMPWKAICFTFLSNWWYLRFLILSFCKWVDLGMFAEARQVLDFFQAKIQKKKPTFKIKAQVLFVSSGRVSGGIQFFLMAETQSTELLVLSHCSWLLDLFTESSLGACPVLPQAEPELLSTQLELC